MSDVETQTQIKRRTGGRSARVRAAVLQATQDVIAERGPKGVSISEIARAAGVHGSSILRRWGSVENLILDALLDYSQSERAAPNTGTLRTDLIALAQRVQASLDKPLGTALSRAMAVADDDPALADSRAQYWQSRVDAASAIFERATDRGELPAGADPRLVLELLVAPLHTRALITRWPVDDGVIEQIVDALLRGVSSP
ncbi:AcrR family transcriptional regulator [Mycobacterium sp. MAA66]|uniref:TetR/AcrR family transcriptional regulator n=1 Tax=Mycobacterium sp. MAA66 TaxID=3156297 RepID=UPI003518B9ED